LFVELLGEEGRGKGVMPLNLSALELGDAEWGVVEEKVERFDGKGMWGEYVIK